MRLVAKSIWDRVWFAVELDDLIGYGTIGLVRAVERYDPERGILLKTYAEHRIRGAMMDGLREMDWLSRGARQKERQQRQERITEGTSPAPDSQPSKTATPLRSDAKLQGGTREPGPPHMESVFPGGNLGDLEKLAESAGTGVTRSGIGMTPEDLFEQTERFDRLNAAVSRLPRRQQQILQLYYQQENSMREIGILMRVHESRISQLHAAVISRLRKELAGMNQISSPSYGKPPQRYVPPELPEDCSSRLTANQSCSVSTPMVS